MTKTVCILPRFRPGDIGGVAQHIAALRRHLPSFGWEVVDDPGAADLVHTHAIERWPETDIFSCHGIYPIRQDMPRWQSEANAAIFDNIKLARRVIAVSRWTAEQWAGLTGVSPKIIHNGVDPQDWIGVERGVWRARLRIPESRPVVLWGKTYISDVLDPAPAVEIALRNPDMTVVAPLPKEALRFAPPNMALVGVQPFDQMKLLLADCDVYLATVCENHSIQLLEALALGKPVLGYAHGGTAETLAGSQAGLLVEPGNLEALLTKLKSVLQEGLHSESLLKMGLAGQALVAERFTWQQIAGQLAAEYDDVYQEKQVEAANPIVCSIIIPCYNKAPYVVEAIESAVNQRGGPPHEVIIVDDGSTDGSLAAICSYVGIDRVPGVWTADTAIRGVPVRVMTKRNGGVAAARNTGIFAAKGRYICCLDADDRIDPLFLARLAPALDSDPGLGIAYSDMAPFGFDPRRGGHWQSYVQCDEYSFDLLIRRNFLPCCNLFRRKAWERAFGYKDINPSWEDYELWLNMGKLGWPGRRIPAPLFYYRIMPAVGRNHESQGLEWKLRAKVNSYHRDLYPPTVSVVIPCYQHSKYLADAIQSALVQTFPDLEVVVVDDGNEPEEAEAIQRIVEAAGPAVRLVRLVENSKLATARNTGIEAARGEWIVPLDADDVIEPGFVEESLAAIKLNPREFAYTDSILWWPEDGREQHLEAAEYDFTDLLTRITWPCTVLYAKDAWRQAGGYKPQMSEAGGWEDWEFVISLGEIGICGAHVAQPLFRYRQSGPGQMRYEAERRKPVLQEAMRRLHAATFRGEFSMACCGKRSAGQQVVQAAQGIGGAMETRAASVPDETVLVRYTGASVGTQTWTAPSGRRYQFGLSDPLKYVKAADVGWLTNLPYFQAVTA